jgi:type IV secretion system protein TrbL
MENRTLRLLICGLTGNLVVCLTSVDALAQNDPNNALDTITALYADHSAVWETILQTYALRLFWLLAGIEFTWAAVRLAVKGADFGDWLAEIVNQILFIGFFLTLLLNSADWAAAIVGSFREAANQASTASGGTGNITPSNIFDVGLQLANRILEQSSIWAPGDSLGLIISALVILICFALIAAFMILALVESYIVISAGVLLMGFGGSRWTKDYAIKVVVYAVSVGAKLFVLQLLVGLGEAMIQGWLATFETSTTDIFIMVGSAVVMLALTKSVPDMVQALINGTSVGSGSAITGATAAVGAATLGTAAVAVGAGAALGGAARLASVQAAASADPPSSMARAARLTGNTMKNLGGAAVEDIGRRLGGRAHHGTMGGRMADSLFQRARDASAELNKPQAPRPQQPPDANTIRPA